MRKKWNLFRMYDTFSAVLNMFLTFSFGLFCIYALFFELVNFNNNTIALTNFGFAILLGFSSVSFSWARNLTTDDKKKAKQLNSCGIDSLYGAITFLMGSGFKYIAFPGDHPETKFVHESSVWLIYIPRVLAYICFTMAVIRFYNVISELIKVVFISQNEEWDYERQAKTNQTKTNQTESIVVEKKETTETP